MLIPYSPDGSGQTLRSRQRCPADHSDAMWCSMSGKLKRATAWVRDFFLQFTGSCCNFSGTISIRRNKHAQNGPSKIEIQDNSMIIQDLLAVYLEHCCVMLFSHFSFHVVFVSLMFFAVRSVMFAALSCFFAVSEAATTYQSGKMQRCIPMQQQTSLSQKKNSYCSLYMLIYSFTLVS